MSMVTKTITITKEAYEKLASNKDGGESFSELINRSFAKKGNVESIMKFAGAWSNMSDETAEKIKKHIESMRGSAGKQRRKELMKHLK